MFNRRFKRVIPWILGIAFILGLGADSYQRWFWIRGIHSSVHLKMDINDVNNLAPSLNTRVASVADTVHIKVDINDVNDVAPNLNVKVNDVNIDKSYEEIDAWQTATAATLVVGATADLSNYRKVVYNIEIAPIEAVATDGCEGWVEISNDEINWNLLYPITGTAETVATTTIVGTVADSNTVIRLTDATTGDFDTNGRKWFIKDGTIGNSESVRTKSQAANVVTLFQDVYKGHAASTNVYDRVDDWILSIPKGTKYARLICNNVDADCDAAFHTWVNEEE